MDVELSGYRIIDLASDLPPAAILFSNAGEGVKIESVGKMK
jgi:hypothetical protein